MSVRSQAKRGQDKVTAAGRWVGIPLAMLQDMNLSTHERMLCALLYTYAGNEKTCYPLQETLAEQMHTTKRSVQRWLNGLQNHGYLVVRRTIYGNHYDIQNPQNPLTEVIAGSHPKPIPGSPPTILGSLAEATPESHASSTKNHDHLESPIIPPPTPRDDDDDSETRSRDEDIDRVGKLLKKVGIGAWRKVSRELAGVNFGLIERRVMKLVDQGKEPGIIVMSLRELDFEPGSMDEAGPLPTDKNYWRSQGFVLGGDEVDSLEPLLDLSDPELKEYFEQCRKAKLTDGVIP